MPDNDVTSSFNLQDFTNPLLYNSSLFGDIGEAAGYQGNMWGGDAQFLQEGESGGMYSNPETTANDDFKGFLSSLNYGNRYLGGNNNDAILRNVSDPNGKKIGTFEFGNMNRNFGDQWAGPLIMGGATAILGGGLGSMFGGGVAGNAAGGALVNGAVSEASGGSFKDGAIAGALSGGLGSLNTAGAIGLDKGTWYGKALNAAVGGALSSAATGGNKDEIGTAALTSGIGSGVKSGINTLGQSVSNYFNDWLSQYGGNDGGSDEFGALQGSGGDMSGQTDVTPSSYDDTMPNSGGENPNYRFAGDFSPLAMGGMDGMRTMQSGSPDGGLGFSMPSFNGMGDKLGGFLGNNLGDIVSMLYGYRNNKRQRQALGQQMSNLQGLFGPNSPYAQQAKAKIDAQAAQKGQRSNVGARANQLAALLADKQASLAPQLYQMQQGQQGLQNNNMNMLLQGLNKTGLLRQAGQGLQGMFQQNPFANYNMNGNTSNYNDLSPEGYM